MSIWFADCEVFAHDTLWMFAEKNTEKVVEIWNDPAAVESFLNANKPILCGYNFRDYDSHILKATLLKWELQDIHRVSDTIINSDDRMGVWGLFQDHPYVELPPVIDLFHDIVPRKGLKEIEANLGMDIVESSVPFTIERPLTESERQDVSHYCRHDLAATAALYQVRFDYLRAKASLCKMRGIDPLTMMQHTNARIVSEVLGAVRLPDLPQEHYQIPDNIITGTLPDAVVSFVETITTENCTTDTTKVEFMFHGCPTVVGMGGIHAAVPAYMETSTDERVILIQDIGSYYPSIILNNGYMSRAVPDAGIYRDFYTMRMKAKAEGDKATADAAKLVLNTTFGTMKDYYNKMYDPMQATRVCVSGELYIIDLIEHVFRAVGDDLTLIQLNTDGWVISLPRAAVATLEGVVSEWQRRTGFTVDTEEVEVIVQANVNNYVMRTTDGRVKAKGGVVGNHTGGTFLSNSMSIVDAAVTSYLLDGTPIEDTIAGCDDLSRYQIVAKMGSTFDKMVYAYGAREREVQRVNRVYATTDARCGGIYKVKMKDGKEVSRSKVPLTPARCWVDNANEGLTTLDKAWYISLAQRKATEFITRDKREREQMANVKEDTNELEKPKPKRKAPAKDKQEAMQVETTEAKEAQPPMTFHARLLELQKVMQGVSPLVSFDKVISNINYEYADTQQYKKFFAQACISLDLLVKIDMSVAFLGLISPPERGTPVYGAEATGVLTITDPFDPTTQETYTLSGFGSNVQPGFCNGAAQTNALRNFILNNWFLDNRGREGDDQSFNAMTESTSRYHSTADKAQIKQDLVASQGGVNKYATEIFAEALYKKVIEAQAVESGFGAAMLAEHYDEDGNPNLREDGKSTMLKTQAVQGMSKAEAIIAKGGSNG